MVADFLRQTLGAMISRRHTPATNLSRAVWGEELLQQSLSTLWYPTEWRDVGDDELVLFLPSLSSDGDVGAEVAIRRAFIRRLRASIRMLEPNDDGRALRKIADVGAISSLLREIDSWGVTEDGHGSQVQSLAARCSIGGAAAWEFELAVLACIDRMLSDATRFARPADCLIETPELADILVGSIHTSINGAYAYPRYAFAHEILGTGAWMGTLLRGRSALMPNFVAEVVLAYLDPAKRSQPTVYDPIENVFAWHAGLIGGASLLVRHAHKARRSGYPQLVKPGGPARGSKLKCSWNLELERVISHRMTLPVN